MERVEIAAVKTDGSTIDVSAQISAIRDELGAIEGFSVIAHDITELKNAQEQRDRFIAVASDQLKTTITTILGFAELLFTRVESAAARQEWLRIIYNDSLRMKEIINDMLDVAWINEGLELYSEPTDIFTILEKIVVEARIRAADRAIVMDGDPSLPRVIGDGQKLAQVFSNLVDNAIKYSPNGGEILVNTQRDVAWQRVVVSVSDHGLGISEEEQPEPVHDVLSRAARRNHQHQWHRARALYRQAAG